MAQVSITQLPQAQALTGTEAVPIVQNGVTVQTTTAALAGAGALNYPFLTVGSTAGLTDARYLATGTGLSLDDNGAGNTLQINLTGAALSLDEAGTGLIVKTGPNTVADRLFEVGTGLTIDQADGIAGNPKISLGDFLSHFVSLTGTGMLAIQSGTVNKVTIQGTANQIGVTNGDGAGDITLALASNPVMPGTGAMKVPVGTSAQQPPGAVGLLRYNTTTDTFDGYAAGQWRQFSLAGGVSTFSGGATGLTPTDPTSGAVVLGGILNPASGGTGVDNGVYTTTLGGYMTTGGDLTTGGALTTAAAFTTAGAFALTLTSTGPTNVTLPTTGTLATLAGTETLTNKTISGSNNTLSDIGNSSLTNSSVTYNGVTVALGGSGTITATTTAALTVGTGLQLNSGTTFDGSAAKTISIDNTVVTLSGTQTLQNKTLTTPVIAQIVNTGTLTLPTSTDTLVGRATTDTLTNKSMSGSSNTFTNIPNSALTNSAVTIGTTSTSLGGTSLTLEGLTSVTVTQDPTTALQLATKQYVDNVAQGLNVKAAVVWGTTGNIVLTGLTTQAGGEWTGLLTAGDRILVKNQTIASQNGIYAASALGWTRTTDADTWNELVSAFVFVEQGATLGDTGWVCTADPGGTLGVTAVNFVQFSGAGTYTAGTGLTLTGTQFSITNTGVTASTYGSASAVPVFAVNAQGQITSVTNTSISIAASQVTSGTLAVAQGGTNIASYTIGDLLYASGATTLSKLNLGTSGYVLTAGASAPQYVAQSTLSVGSATNATNTGITASTTNADHYLTFVTATTGNLPQLVNSSVTVNPSTGKLTGGIAGGAF